MKKLLVSVSVGLLVLALPGAARASALYAADAYTLYDVNMGTGTLTTVGSLMTDDPSPLTFDWCLSMAFDLSGQLWGHGHFRRKFGIINTSTAVVSTLPTQTPAGAQIAGITFDLDGNFYAVNENSPYEVWQVNTTTGALTLLGNTDRRFAGVTFGADGVLYGIKHSIIYSLDAATYASTLVGSSGAGLDLSAYGGGLLGTQGGTSKGLWEINLDPFGSTFLFGWTPNIDAMAYWPVPVAETIPELGTLAVLAAGALAIAALRRTRG